MWDTLYNLVHESEGGGIPYIVYRCRHQINHLLSFAIYSESKIRQNGAYLGDHNFLKTH